MINCSNRQNLSRSIHAKMTGLQWIIINLCHFISITNKGSSTTTVEKLVQYHLKGLRASQSGRDFVNHQIYFVLQELRNLYIHTPINRM